MNLNDKEQLEKTLRDWIRSDVKDLKEITNRLEIAVARIEATMHSSPCPALEEIQIFKKSLSQKLLESVVRIITWLSIGALGWFFSQACSSAFAEEKIDVSKSEIETKQ